MRSPRLVSELSFLAGTFRSPHEGFLDLPANKWPTVRTAIPQVFFPDRDIDRSIVKKLPVKRTGETRGMTSIPHKPPLDENYIELCHDSDPKIIIVGTTRVKDANGSKYVCGDHDLRRCIDHTTLQEAIIQVDCQHRAFWERTAESVAIIVQQSGTQYYPVLMSKRDAINHNKASVRETLGSVNLNRKLLWLPEIVTIKKCNEFSYSLTNSRVSCRPSLSLHRNALISGVPKVLHPAKKRSHPDRRVIC